MPLAYESHKKRMTDMHAHLIGCPTDDIVCEIPDRVIEGCAKQQYLHLGILLAFLHLLDHAHGV